LLLDPESESVLLLVHVRGVPGMRRLASIYAATMLGEENLPVDFLGVQSLQDQVTNSVLAMVVRTCADFRVARKVRKRRQRISVLPMGVENDVSVKAVRRVCKEVRIFANRMVEGIDADSLAVRLEQGTKVVYAFFMAVEKGASFQNANMALLELQSSVDLMEVEKDAKRKDAEKEAKEDHGTVSGMVVGKENR